MSHLSKIFIFIILCVVSISIQSIISSIDSFRVDQYAVSTIQSISQFENKSIINAEIEGERIVIPLFFTSAEKEFFQFSPGDNILVKEFRTTDRHIEYTFLGRFQIGFFVSLIFIFMSILLLFFGIRIILPFLSLFLSLFFLITILIPALLAGKSVFLYGILGATGIVLISILFSHGFKKSSFLAAFSSLLALGLAYILGEFFVQFLHLFGQGSTNISYLNVENTNLSLQGVFLVGIYLGIIGVIDDVTTAQSTAIQELSEANPQYSFQQLYTSGMVIGKAHVFSMINSLVFAYFGAGIAMYFSLFSLNYPWWVLINLPFIQEELLRVILGSFTLTIAIPMTSLFSAYFFQNTIQKRNDK